MSEPSAPYGCRRAFLLGALVAAAVGGWLELRDRHRYAFELVAVFDGTGPSARTGFMIDSYRLVEKRRFRIDPEVERFVALYHPVRTTGATVELFAGTVGSDSGPPFQVHQRASVTGSDLGRHCTILARVENGRATLGVCVPSERGPALIRGDYALATRRPE